MQISMKRTIYLGLAALGFVAVAGATNATSVSAKSYAKSKLTKNLDKNVNVALNGKNALYTREGTFKGAKKIASTTTLKKLNQSKYGQDNWMAYRYTITDRGSVYYKVVSFDKTYRGWIYGGKAANKFAGGLSTYATLKATDTISDTNKGNFKFATPGKTNDGTSLTYKDPMWTKMGSGRRIKDSTKYADDVLVITKQGTRSREGDEWVYVNDETNPKVSGWVMRKGLTANDKISASQGVTINYLNMATDKTVGSAVIKFVDNKSVVGNELNDGKMDVTEDDSGAYDHIPAGFSLLSHNAWVDMEKAEGVTKGGSATVYVLPNSKTTSVDVNFLPTANAANLSGNFWSSLTVDQQKAYAAVNTLAKYQVNSGAVLSGATVKAMLQDAKLDSFDVTINGKKYHATLNNVKDLPTVKDDKNVHPNAYFDLK